MGTKQFTSNDLDIKPINRNSPIPYHQQIRLELLGFLNSMTIKPGDMLPSEHDLARAYQVSRQTVRHAIGALESENLVERTPGKGTIALEVKPKLALFLDQSFSQQMILEGKTPYSKVLKKRLFTVDDSSTKVLHGMIGLDAMELIRLRFDGNIPIGIEYSITITERCQDIHTYDFSKQSLYNLLLYHYKLPVEEIHQSVGAVLSDQWHSELLKTNLNSPLLSITTTAFLENNELIETSNAFYRADKYEFKIRSKV